jgi:primosomal protein N''
MDVLVEAKKEYLGQLCIIMVPAMIETFENMYKESVTMCKGKKVLIQFQKLLKEVPNWSNAMSKQHSDNIANRCAWFSDLLAAVFVACTKILSSVRLNSTGQKISLKLPATEVFIQTCYNNIAKDLYKDPYVYHEEQSEYTRDETLTARMSACIENTVKELIPVQQILQTYMTSQDADKNIELGDEGADLEDPEEVYDESEPTQEAAPVVEEPEPLADAEPEPETETEPEPEPEVETPPVGLENEFKTIPDVPAQDGEEEEEEDGVLFGDAPERRR